MIFSWNRFNHRKYKGDFRIVQVYKNNELFYYIDGYDVQKSNWMRYVNPAYSSESQNLIACQYKVKQFYGAHLARRSIFQIASRLCAEKKLTIVAIYAVVSDEHLFLHDQADITAPRVAGLVLQGIRGKAQLSAHRRADASENT